MDAHVLPAGKSLRVANTPEGIRKLKRWLRRFAVTLIAVEATGKWHRALHRSLHAEGWRVAVVDPFRVRMFAKAHGILAKTDKLDARVLAIFAATMDPTVRPPAPEALEVLQELVRKGVLSGQRGPRGGYRLARERRRITVGEIVRVVRELESANDPVEEPNGSEIGVKVVRPIWAEAQDELMVRFDGLTVEELCNRARAARIESEAARVPDFSI